jgi:hypothetical protein
MLMRHSFDTMKNLDVEKFKLHVVPSPTNEVLKLNNLHNSTFINRKQGLRKVSHSMYL